jgi:hypothetical protein
MSFRLLSRVDPSVGTGATTTAVLTRFTFAAVDCSDIVNLGTDGLVVPIEVENRRPQSSWRMDLISRLYTGRSERRNILGSIG